MTSVTEIPQRSRLAARNVASLVVCFIAGLATALAYSPLQITTPPAGAILTAGEPVTVEWTGGDPSWSVDVTLIDVDAWTVVAYAAANVPNSGTVTWTIPTSLAFGGPCNRTYQFYVQEVSQLAWRYGPHFTVVCETTVDVDIHPGSDPNSVNPRSRGVIPFAILTTPWFDAATVDPGSVAFGPNAAVPTHASLEDADGDGDLDLVLQVRTQETGIACGDTSAALTGLTLAGQAIVGADGVRTVGCR